MDLGFTQQTLADRLGCCYESVAGWERGGSPLARRWPAIQAVLGPDLVPVHDGLSGQIRAARLRLGLTHQELADRAGLDRRTIRNVERGIHPPSRRTLQKLRQVIAGT